MNRISATLFAALSAMSLCAAPSVTGVSIRQDASSHLVTIEYTLEGTAPACIQVSVLTNGVSIGDAAFAGAKGVVSGPVNPGKQTILWKPSRTWPGYVFRNKEVSVQVKASALNTTPDYMILDLENPTDIRYYNTTAEFPVALGDDCYRSRYIVMRKIPAAGVKWRMGTPESEITTIGSWFACDYENTHYVTLTQDYYMSIYELTSYQYDFVESGVTTGALTPVTKSYNTVRGTGKVWPTDEHAVSGGWLSKLREKFGGFYEFDLPTEAQWEFACRAGTSTSWHNGKNIPSGADVAVADLSAIAWYGKNADQKLHLGGLQAANNYGLYDMLGNVGEICLDNVGGDSLTPYDSNPATDPKGSTTVSDRVIYRGRGYWDAQYYISSGRRFSESRQTANYETGIRLCVTLP